MNRFWRWVGGLVLAMGATLSAAQGRSDVMVIVNDNSADSPQVGAYYAEKRGIVAANIVHVRVPAQFFISWSDFLSLRDQILRNGMCRLASGAMTDVGACADASLPIYTPENLEYFRNQSGIGYLVFTRGVPTRMTPPGGEESNGVDLHLRFSLARYITEDDGLYTDRRYVNMTDAAQPTGQPITDVRRRKLRPVIPALDWEYIVGRIDGISLQSALDVVDRTLRAEGKGFHGKIYTSTEVDAIAWQHLFNLRDESRSECADPASPNFYLNFPQEDLAGKTPPHCLVKVVRSGTDWMPGVDGFLNDMGRARSRQPIADQATAYFGSLNGQELQGGFNTLLSFRKDRQCQSTLCTQASDPAQCRQASTDPLREIDTRCVGVTDGFMGFNYQSYPASLLTAWPTFWGPWNVFGSVEDEAPWVDTTRGSDDLFSLSLGLRDQLNNAQCLQHVNGVLSSELSRCATRSGYGFSQSLPTGSMPAPSVGTGFGLSYQFQAAELEAPVQLRASLLIYFAAPPSASCPVGMRAEERWCIYEANHDQSVTNRADWGTVQWTFAPAAVPASLRVDSAVLRFRSSAFGSGRVTVDNVSLVRLDTGAQLVRNGSFADGHRQSSRGDYAANFMSRLGGTAFWGSVSHYRSWGFVFRYQPHRVLSDLLWGLPLGDAVWLGEGSQSGVFYGDPIFSPTRVKISPLLDVESRIFDGITRVYADVINGVSAAPRTVELAVCKGRYETQAGSLPWRCAQPGGWKIVQQRQLGAETRVAFTVNTASNVVEGYGDYTLRLRLTQSDPTTGEASTISDFYPIRYRYSSSELAAATAPNGTAGGAPAPLGLIQGGLIDMQGHAVLPFLQSVELIGPELRQSLQLDNGGRFQFFVPPGNYELRLSGPACEPIAARAVSPGETVDLVCVPLGNTIRGRVTTASGKALPFADVYAFSPSGDIVNFATTDWDGRYLIAQLPPGEYVIQVVAIPEGTLWHFAPGEVQLSGAPATLSFTALTPVHPLTISGVVRDTTARPMSNQAVQLVPLNANGVIAGEAISTASDINGQFEFPNLTEGVYRIQAGRGWVDVHLTNAPAVVDVAGSIAPSSLTTGAVSGFVSRYVGNSPLMGARVTLTYPDGRAAQVETTTSGFYRFDGLAPGDYRVSVVAGPYSPPKHRTVAVSSRPLINIDFSGL